MEKKKRYPVLSARVSVEQEKRFKLLLEKCRRTQPYMKEPDLVRVLLGFDLNYGVTEDDRLFLSGEIDFLREVDYPARPTSKPKTRGVRK